MQSNEGSDRAVFCTWITAFGSWVLAFFSLDGNLVASAVAMLAAAVAFGTIVRASSKLREP